MLRSLAKTLQNHGLSPGIISFPAKSQMMSPKECSVAKWLTFTYHSKDMGLNPTSDGYIHRNTISSYYIFFVSILSFGDVITTVKSQYVVASCRLIYSHLECITGELAALLHYDYIPVHHNGQQVCILHTDFKPHLVSFGYITAIPYMRRVYLDILWMAFMLNF